MSIKRMVNALVAILIFAAAVGYFKLTRFRTATPAPGDTPVQTFFYEVKPQQKPLTIAGDLEKIGVVTDARIFYWYGRLTGKTRKIKAGDYRFTNKMTPAEVFAVLTSGVSYGLPLTVPEGYTFHQVAGLLEQLRPGSKEKFVRLCTDRSFIAGLGFSPPPESLEGYLFPETYLISPKTPEEEIVRQMVKKYRETFTPEMSARANELGMSEHQVVTLASIVEKETGAKQERPLISAVFHNRLKKKMRLQTDPTVLYGKGDFTFSGNITRKDLETPTPYNTYRIAGLPPGPIGNPGKEALKAALYPAQADYLYFVSHNDGTHEFTSTYEDHAKAVTKFQLDRKMREGKSWRDLGKPAAASN